MRTLITTLFVITLSLGLRAQIVNIEDLRTTFNDSIGWFENIDLGTQLIKNTDQIFTISGGMQLEFKHKNRLFLSLTKFDFLKAGGEEFVNNGLQHLRYNIKFGKVYTHEFFAQIQYNENTNIKVRGLVGTGPRFTLISTDHNKLHWGVAYMYEYNEENAARNIFRDHRISSYLSIALKPADYFKFSNTTYFQPIVNEPKLFRLTTESTLDVTLTRTISFTSSFSLSYDRRIRIGVPTVIYHLKNGIRLKL